MKEFELINKGYNSVFVRDQLSLGLVVPIENYSRGPVPTMQEHLQVVKHAESLGFKGIWLRDIPFNVPSFGDAGQTFDPFTYLGYLAGQTDTIALGIASIALPLHHPVHIAKSVATIDQLSDGRMILGVASGDRYDEYPAMNIDYEQRGEAFRSAFEYLRKVREDFPMLENNQHGTLLGNVDVLPKPKGTRIPLIMTGSSRQTLEWNAQHADGWMYYPRGIAQQQFNIEQWRSLIAEQETFDKPFMQPLYLDLQEDDDYKPQPIHLGLKVGVNYLNEYLQELQRIGVNHLAFNLRFNQGKINSTLERLAEKTLPLFHL